MGKAKPTVAKDKKRGQGSVNKSVKLPARTRHIHNSEKDIKKEETKGHSVTDKKDTKHKIKEVTPSEPQTTEKKVEEVQKIKKQKSNVKMNSAFVHQPSSHFITRP